MHGTGRLLYEIISKLLSFIVKSRTYRTVYAPVRNGRVFTDTRQRSGQCGRVRVQLVTGHDSVTRENVFCIEYPATRLGSDIRYPSHTPHTTFTSGVTYPSSDASRYPHLLYATR